MNDTAFLHHFRRGRVPAIIAVAVLHLAASPGPAVAQLHERPAAASATEPQAASNHRFHIRRTDGPMRVDARLDEPAWEEAQTITLPLEISPRDHAPAAVETRCRVTFDETHLYLGCNAFDPEPAGIRARLTGRDGIIGNHDRISFLLDPFNDSRRGFVFEISPLGVQADLVYDERTSAFDSSWDGIWDSAGRLTEAGYVVEAAIPFRTLRFPSRGPHTWRFWIYRMRPRSELAVLSSNTRLRGEACRLCQAHLLEGLDGMRPGLNMEVVPTLTGRRTVDADGTVQDGAPVDAGLDVRWSVTSNLALNATLNPDFSQVEADTPRLAANNAFALRFPEKRPFFLEGADLFQTPTEVAFTRSIVAPSAGVKLTGKHGAHAVGMLFALDETNHLVLPGTFGSQSATSDEQVATTFLRYRRDLGETHTVGGIVTSRIGADGYRNQVAGIDLFVQPAAGLTVTGELLASESQYTPDIAARFSQPEGHFTGGLARSELQYTGRVWGGNAGSEIRGTGFRADAGFVPQVGTRAHWLNGRHIAYGSGARLTQLETTAGVFRTDETTGALLNDGVWLNLRYQGPRQSEAWFNPVWQRQVFLGATHERPGATLRPWSWLRTGLSGNAGTEVDFRNGGTGTVLRLSPSLTAELGRRGELDVRYSYQRLEKAGANVFTAQVSEMKAVYNLSARAFVRAIVQYRRTTRNPATNPGLARSTDEALLTQLLFSYKLNPLTVVFLGVADDRVGFEDLGRPRTALARQGRTLFFKLGYAWRP